jgi:hypothetical protein
MGRVFSFAEVVTGRDSSVPVTDDGLLHAVPYVMVMSGKNNDDAGKAIRNIPNEIFQSEKFTDRQLSKRGGYPTKLISFHDAIELAMVLPGKIARETRTKFASIIQRYLAGDQSLISEIQDNAVSTLPIAQLARESLQKETRDEVSRKRQIEKDDMLFEMDMVERRQKQLHLAFETQSAIMAAYTQLCPGQVMDDRARLLFKDNMLNLAMQQAPMQKAIANGGDQAKDKDSDPITVSTYALRKGRRYNLLALQKIGSIMSRLYKKRYGHLNEDKHEQFTDGAVRDVNSYTKKDLDLLDEAFRIYEAGVKA